MMCPRIAHQCEGMSGYGILQCNLKYAFGDRDTLQKKKKKRLVISFLFLLNVIAQAKLSSLPLPCFSFPTFCTT